MAGPMYFSDGRRLIDYVVAFKSPSPLIEEDHRACFLNLVQHGLDIEIEGSSSEAPIEFTEELGSHQFQKDELLFAKLHVKWDTLLQVAEILRFQKPMAIGNEIIYDSFTMPRRSVFNGFSDDAVAFFTPEERILAAEYILSESSYQGVGSDDHNSSKRTALLPIVNSVEELKTKGVILASFPLHEPKTKSTRAKLLKNWASPRKIMNLQPLDEIRKYFGEKVAFSFAWIQFFSWSFLSIFIVALVVSLIPPFLKNPPHSIIKEVCSPNATQFILCPTCNRKNCRFRKLKKSCEDLKWTYFFDNPVSVFIAFIAPIFGMACLRLWTYQQSKLEYRWHMQNYKSADEPSRWRYLKRVNQRKYADAKKTGLPFWTYRLPVFTFTVFTTITLISLSIALEVITDSICSQLEERLSRSDVEFTSESAPFIAMGFSQVLNAICVCILSAMYKRWIGWSTTTECHRTEEEHEQSFLMKSSFMELINMYLSIFTGIIVRALNYGYPGQSSSFLESPEWPVWSGLFGLFYEIYIKCTTIVFIKSAKEWIPWSQAKEAIKPVICGHHSTPRPKKEISTTNVSESYRYCFVNYNMAQPEDYPLFQRQFDECIFIGFAILFLPVSFTWVLTFLLLNALTIRGFAIKVTRQLRRISPKRARSIGIWMWILKGITVLSILTNACLIAFASEFVNKLVYQVYYSPDGSLNGYINFTLSYMNVSSFEISARDKKLLKGAQYCRYYGFREPPNSARPFALTSVFWHILAVKFIFAFVFIVAVLSLIWFLSCIMPTAPRRVAAAKENERGTVNNLILRGDL